jgi:PIN domain nuclease of toxin-antitoxin system
VGGRALILVDTHVLVWLDEGDPVLGATARERADQSLQDQELAVSTISFWEIAMLRQKGRLGVHRPLEPWRRGLIELGLIELPLDGQIAVSAGELDGLHGDPADRIIAATAMHHGAHLMTADRSLLSWSGPIECIDARA